MEFLQYFTLTNFLFGIACFVLSTVILLWAPLAQRKYRFATLTTVLLSFLALALWSVPLAIYLSVEPYAAGIIGIIAFELGIFTAKRVRTRDSYQQTMNSLSTPSQYRGRPH